MMSGDKTRRTKGRPTQNQEKSEANVASDRREEIKRNNLTEKNKKRKTNNAKFVASDRREEIK